MSDTSHRDPVIASANSPSTPRGRHAPPTADSPAFPDVRRRRGGCRVAAAPCSPPAPARRSSKPAAERNPTRRVSGNRARSQLLRDDAHLTATRSPRGVFALRIRSNTRLQQEKNHAAHAQDRYRPRSRPAASRHRRPDRDDGPPRVPEALGPGRRRRRVREPVAVRHDGQGAGGRRHGERQARGASHRLHALLGRLRDRRRRRERRVGAPGAGVRFAAQPRRALREGRVDPRARPRRASAEDADEARQRQVPEDHAGTRRSTSSATS